MQIFRLYNKRYLTFEYHELCFSIRTCKFVDVVFNEYGDEIQWIDPVKNATKIEIPKGRIYYLKRYFTNRGYPEHSLFLITEDDRIVLVLEIKRDTPVETILQAQIPKRIKRFIIDDVLGD